MPMSFYLWPYRNWENVCAECHYEYTTGIHSLFTLVPTISFYKKLTRPEIETIVSEMQDTTVSFVQKKQGTLTFTMLSAGITIFEALSIPLSKTHIFQLNAWPFLRNIC